MKIKFEAKLSTKRTDFWKMERRDFCERLSVKVSVKKKKLKEFSWPGCILLFKKKSFVEVTKLTHRKFAKKEKTSSSESLINWKLFRGYEEKLTKDFSSRERLRGAERFEIEMR